MQKHKLVLGLIYEKQKMHNMSTYVCVCTHATLQVVVISPCRAMFEISSPLISHLPFFQKSISSNGIKNAKFLGSPKHFRLVDREIISTFPVLRFTSLGSHLPKVQGKNTELGAGGNFLVHKKASIWES